MITRLFLVALITLNAATAFGQTAPQAAEEKPPAQEPALSPTPAPPAASARARTDLVGDLSAEVVARLKDEQLLELLKDREKTRARLASAEPPLVAIIIPIAAFVTTFFIVALILRGRADRDARLHETMRKMIEKGLEIPPTLFLPPQQRHADLRKGLILVGAGLGIAAALYTLGDPGTFTLALIPLLIGVGYLVVWQVERKQA